MTLCNDLKYGLQCKMGKVASNNSLIDKISTMVTEIGKELSLMISAEYLLVLIIKF